MTTEPTILWSGQSGKEYKYWISDLNSTFKQSPGNYIFTKETQPGRFVPIYIGQTSNLSERLENHDHLPCIRRNGATHICSHTSSNDEATRRAEEDDLIQHWSPICND